MDVTTTPHKLGSFGYLIQNLGPDDLYVGEESVDSDTGFKVPSGSAVTVGNTAWDVWVVSDGTSEVYTLGEGGGLYSPPAAPAAPPDLSPYETTAAHNSSIANYVAKSLYDANTILAATTDDTPTALTVAASRVVGRKASGGIAALTGAEVQALLDLSAYLTTSAAASGYQPLDSDLTAIAALTTTSYGRALLSLANAAAADWVPNALFDANTTLVAHTDNTPVAVAISANQVVGRGNSGNIKGLTAAETAAIVSTEVFTQPQGSNSQTGTTYTLVAADGGKRIDMSNAAAITLTLPQDSDATIAVGTYLDVYQAGAGQITVVAGTGATLRVSGLTAKSRAQYSRLGLQKVSANTWSLFGDLAAS